MKTSIICTGYSLKGVDLSKIEGHITAVNYACRYVDYDLLCAFDDPIKYEFPVDNRLHTNQIYKDKYRIDCNGWFRGRSYNLVRNSLIAREIFGRSGSLFCAINVLIKLGFKEIHVYGADMCLTDGYSHFYSTKKLNPKGLPFKMYERSFSRHKKTKALFMSQLLEDEQIIWH
jgi:hypothetical protein